MGIATFLSITLVLGLIAVGVCFVAFRQRTDPDVAAILGELLPVFCRRKDFFEVKYGLKTEWQLREQVATWVSDKRRNGGVVSPTERQAYIESRLKSILAASEKRYDEWIERFVPEYLERLVQEIPDIGELQSEFVGLPREYIADRRDGAVGGKWLREVQHYKVGRLLKTSFYNLNCRTEEEIRRRFPEVLAYFRNIEDTVLQARADAKKQKEARRQQAEQQKWQEREDGIRRQEEEERRRREVELAAQEEREREKESLRLKQEIEQRLIPERPRRIAARNSVELVYLEYATEVSAVFDKKALEDFLRVGLGDDRPLPEVEAAAAAFPDRMRKRVAQQRLVQFYSANCELLSPYYPLEMLQSFLQSNLGDHRSVAEVEEAAKLLQEKLELVVEKETVRRSAQSIDATTKDLKRQTATLEALANVVKDLVPQADEEVVVLEQLVKGAAAAKRQQAVEEIVKAELADEPSALKRQ